MEMEIPEFEEDWSSVNFTATGLFKRTELENSQLVMTLKMGNVIIDCKPQLLFDTDPEPDMKAMADLDFINRKTFQLIQTIQKATTREDRANALAQLIVIDSTLDARYEQFMKIKNRSLKKTLCSQLLECKSRSSNVIGLLRQI